MCTPECMIAMLGCPAFNEAVKAVIKAGKYARQYRMHVDNLRTELGHLEDARVRIERRVREARDRGEEIENAVTHWQANVGRMENDVQELIGQVEARMHCFACSCPNIKLRYRLGKQAEEKIRDVHRLIEDSHFEQIAHPRSPPPELEFPSTENYVHLDSRTPIFEQIVVALKDPNVKMIGVHGLGGVGKTTLVEKVAKKMLDDGTFKQIPLAAVSRVLNVKEIQKKLAENLNLRLDAPTDEKANQTQLWHKFRNGDNYLVILDDIWAVVDLIAIGIPITDGKIGCKVVLTSRNKDLLEIRMKTDRNFPIAELQEGEAWDLFKKQVGNSMESQPGMESLAREVCKKCKGLPVAIKALGAALEGKPDYVWKSALDMLERYMLTDIEGIDPGVWASLKVSYNELSPKAKSCFLFCCLFAEDAQILIDDLMRYFVARNLLSQNLRTLEKERNVVRSVVDALKSASLLSNGSNENVVRIHDVIRDVGISIAREEQAFLVDHGALQWPRNLVNEPLAISLNSGKIRVLPDGLVYPQLHTLILDNNELSDLEVPDKFFSGIKQLTVLILIRIRMRRLPSSLAKLSNLRMLCLNQCKLADIAILGDLKTNLEVFSLRGSKIEALRLEMSQLTSLRVLDLRDCDDLKVIPQGIVSNLTNLEELYFADKFDKWEATIDEEKDMSRSKNVSIEEIRLLLNTGQLTTLHIHIPSVTLLPKEDLMLENLKGFRISMGTNFNWDENFAGTRVLKYGESSLRKEFIPLVDKAEALYLSGIKGLKEVLDYRGVGNEFLDLKDLKVKSCDDDLEYLLGEPKSSVQNHGLYPFNHLTGLTVQNCKLKYLFSPTTARGLVHLEQLSVVSCKNIREIVGFERQNNENELIGEVKFSKLKQLELKYLPELISFYAGKEKTQAATESSSTLAQPLFNEKRSTTIFVDNLPFHIRKIWLYNLFSRFGIIRDLFIPTKRSKITGHKFAFVRFSKVEDAETAISKTKDSWYWDRKLVVKFARFLRDVDVQDPQRSFNRNYTINSKSWKQNSHFSKGFPFNYKSNQWKPNAQSSPFKGKNLFHQSNLYDQKHQKFPNENRGKEVWRRRGIEETSKQGEQRNGKINETPETLHMGSIKVQSAGNGWLFRSAVAKMSRLISTEDLEHVFRREGDHKVQIKTLGGRFVIITFPDVASRDSIIKERWLSKWFEEIRPWKGEQANEERFVWLSCYGMPLNAWSAPTFKEIGDKWGKFLQIEEATLKEFSYAKAMILIATNQIHKIEGYVDLIIDKEIFTVRVMEEDSFRFIKQSFFDISSDLAMEEDDDKAMNKDEVDKPADVGSKNGPQEESSNDEVANSNFETGVPVINDVAACIMESMSSSSLGIENSIVGSEMVADSFVDSSKENQSQSKSPNCLLDKESEMMMDSKMGAILDKEELNDKDGKVVVAIENEHDCYYANVNTVEEPNLDHFEANQIPIQAAIKGIKGKRNRKSINEILGYTKVNSGNIKGKRNKKCVVLRSAVASAALSASISSAEINNRNRILLDEAQAIWTVDKLFGISYDGDENEVISKIAEMEALNKVRANENSILFSPSKEQYLRTSTYPFCGMLYLALKAVSLNAPPFLLLFQAHYSLAFQSGSNCEGYLLLLPFPSQGLALSFNPKPLECS